VEHVRHIANRAVGEKLVKQGEMPPTLLTISLATILGGALAPQNPRKNAKTIRNVELPPKTHHRFQLQLLAASPTRAPKSLLSVHASSAPQPTVFLSPFSPCFPAF
jgi:hypothetical protein